MKWVGTKRGKIKSIINNNDSCMKRGEGFSGDKGSGTNNKQEWVSVARKDGEVPNLQMAVPEGWTESNREHRQMGVDFEGDIEDFFSELIQYAREKDEKDGDLKKSTYYHVRALQTSLLRLSDPLEIENIGDWQVAESLSAVAHSASDRPLKSDFFTNEEKAEDDQRIRKAEKVFLKSGEALYGDIVSSNLGAELDKSVKAIKKLKSGLLDAHEQGELIKDLDMINNVRSLEKDVPEQVVELLSAQMEKMGAKIGILSENISENRESGDLTDEQSMPLKKDLAALNKVMYRLMSIRNTIQEKIK